MRAWWSRPPRGSGRAWTGPAGAGAGRARPTQGLLVGEAGRPPPRGEPTRATLTTHPARPRLDPAGGSRHLLLRPLLQRAGRAGWQVPPLLVAPASQPAGARRWRAPAAGIPEASPRPHPWLQHRPEVSPMPATAARRSAAAGTGHAVRAQAARPDPPGQLRPRRPLEPATERQIHGHHPPRPHPGPQVEADDQQPGRRHQALAGADARGRGAHPAPANAEPAGSSPAGPLTYPSNGAAISLQMPPTSLAPSRC